MRPVRSLPLLFALAACVPSNPAQPPPVTGDLIPSWSAPPPDRLPCELHPVADLRYTVAGGHLFVPALLKGAPVTLLFDTGGNTTLVSHATVNRLKIRSLASFFYLRGIGGASGLLPVGEAPLKIGNFESRHWSFFVSDAMNGLKFRPDGLLGSDFLWPVDIDVDLPERRIVLYSAVHDCSKPTAVMPGDISSVPLLSPFRQDEFRKRFLNGKYARAGDIPEDNTPHIFVTIDGHTLSAAIDTGAPSSVLYLSGAAKLRLRPDAIAAASPTRASGAGPGTVPAYKQVLKNVEFGTVTIRNFPVTLVADSVGTTDMLLGLDLLQKIHMWISHSSGALIMQYPPIYPPPYAPP